MYMVVLGLSETMARLLTNDFGLGNERSEAQGALRLEFNVSRFLAHSFVFFIFMFGTCTLHSFFTKPADQRLKLFSFSSFYFKTL